MNYKSITERIDPLIKTLDGVSTLYASEKAYIGEAQVMLRLLKDILENKNETERV
jgi:hypothetical protein